MVHIVAQKKNYYTLFSAWMPKFHSNFFYRIFGVELSSLELLGGMRQRFMFFEDKVLKTERVLRR